MNLQELLVLLNSSPSTCFRKGNITILFKRFTYFSFVSPWPYFRAFICSREASMGTTWIQDFIPKAENQYISVQPYIYGIYWKLFCLSPGYELGRDAELWPLCMKKLMVLWQNVEHPPLFCVCIHDFILSFYSMCHTELSTSWIILEMWKINSKLTNVFFLQKHSNSHMNVKYQDQNLFL